MINFEGGLSNDQQGLLTGAIDYLSESAEPINAVLPSGALSRRVETDSGVKINWVQQPLEKVADDNTSHGWLLLQLEEETGAGLDITTIVEYQVSAEGVSCEAKEMIDPGLGGHTERTIKRRDIDDTARKMAKLLNRIYA